MTAIGWVLTAANSGKLTIGQLRTVEISYKLFLCNRMSSQQLLIIINTCVELANRLDVYGITARLKKLL